MAADDDDVDDGRAVARAGGRVAVPAGEAADPFGFPELVAERVVAAVAAAAVVAAAAASA